MFLMASARFAEKFRPRVSHCVKCALTVAKIEPKDAAARIGMDASEFTKRMKYKGFRIEELLLIATEPNGMVYPDGPDFWDELVERMRFLYLPVGMSAEERRLGVLEHVLTQWTGRVLEVLDARRAKPREQWSGIERREIA